MISMIASWQSLITNITSSEPATKFVEKYFENKTVPPFKVQSG